MIVSSLTSDLSECGCDVASTQRLMSIAEARSTIVDGVKPIAGTEILSVVQACGRVTAVPLTSQMPLPRFDNSAMDGYGIHQDDWSSAAPLQLEDRIAAGREQIAALEPGTAVQILTGAPVPAGVTAVVPHEQARRINDCIFIEPPITPGDNIRRAGEGMTAGWPLLQAGTRLDPRHIALLLAAGHAHVQVMSRVRVGLMSTGDELASAGEPLGPHQIVDTNRPLLSALLATPDIELHDFGIVADSPQALSERIRVAAARTDLLVTTGGICGSDADHIAPVICAAGGMCRQLKVALRPGKPIGIGHFNGTHILCLPGNPLSALVTSVLFLQPMLDALKGQRPSQLSGIAAFAEEVFRHTPGRTEFVPAVVTSLDPNGHPRLSALPRGSHRLLSLAKADGFAELPEEAGDLMAGDAVSFHPFASGFAL
jgi:molybdopterin molybdotransferase